MSWSSSVLSIHIFSKECNIIVCDANKRITSLLQINNYQTKRNI